MLLLVFYTMHIYFSKRSTVRGKEEKDRGRRVGCTGNSREGAAVRSHCQHWTAVVMALSVNVFTGSWVMAERSERWSWGRGEGGEGQEWRRRAVQRDREVTNWSSDPAGNPILILPFHTHSIPVPF